MYEGAPIKSFEAATTGCESRALASFEGPGAKIKYFENVGNRRQVRTHVKKIKESGSSWRGSSPWTGMGEGLVDSNERRRGRRKQRAEPHSLSV